VPECTEAERALLEMVLKGESSEVAVENAVAKVQSERLTPELRERAIATHAAWLDAGRKKAAVWEELNAVGVVGARSTPLYQEFEVEAKKRLNGAGRG
jgi:hypothetical protein